MPIIADYDEQEDEERPDAVSTGGGASFSGGSARPAQSSAQQESTFTPWSRFMSANQEVSEREAGKLQSQVQSSVDKAVGGRQAAEDAQTKGIESNYERAPSFSMPESGKFNTPRQGPGADASAGFGNKAAFFAPQEPTEAPKGATERVGAAQKPFMASAVPQQPSALMGIDPNKLQTSGETGKPVTTGANLGGGKDLKSAIGADAWSKLIGDTAAASNQAAALGSEGGVQALLSPGATAFDAALIGGAGQPGFQALSKQFGGEQLQDALLGADKGAQEQWQRLMGDVDAAAAARDKDINDYNAEIARNLAGGFVSEPGAAPAEGGAAQPWRPTGYTDLDSFLNGGSDYQDVHEASEYFSLGNWAARGLGEAGIYDGALPSEIVAGMFVGDGAPKNDWGETNIRIALKTVMGEFPSEAVEYLWEHMTPEMWSAYMGQNPGAIARQMRAWLESAGFVETKAPKVNSFEAPEGVKI